jgi:hypothetical protein
LLIRAALASISPSDWSPLVRADAVGFPPFPESASSRRRPFVDVVLINVRYQA